jgi:hypothetical protein
MNDITQNYRFQRILVEAAQYRTLRQIFRADPQVGPNTVKTLREIFAVERDDAEYLHKAAERAPFG